MYKRYFHLDKEPFSIVPDPEFLYLSPRHKEGLAHLLYGVTVSDGFVTLTGEIGTGKTTLCRSLLEKLPENIEIAIILNPKLCARELLATICDELGVSYDRNDLSLKVLTDRLNEHLLAIHAQGKRTVLLIDEAQNLSDEVLEQIRLLTNLETTKAKLLQIVLVGQPELRTKLGQHKLRQLNQRITARYHLDSLTRAETRSYIQHRLSVSGGYSELFSNRAISRVYSLSGGVPRLINILCDRALLGVYAAGKKRVGAGIVSRAAREAYGRKQDSGYRYALAAGLILTIGYVLSQALWPIQSARLDAASLAESSRLLNGSEVAQSLWTNLDASGLFVPNVEAKNQQFSAHATVMNPPMEPADELIAKENTPPMVISQPAESFSAFALNADANMNTAFSALLDSWGETLNADLNPDCQSVQSLGMKCLYDKGRLEDVLAYNRPVILELVSEQQEKFYVMLSGLDEDRLIFRSKETFSFPIAEVLPFWQGHFLLVWRPPSEYKRNIQPQQLSEDVRWLRQHLASIDQNPTPVEQPEYFDQALEEKVIRFQQKHHLAMDGVVGPRTIIHLQNYSAKINFPTLQ